MNHVIDASKFILMITYYCNLYSFYESLLTSATAVELTVVTGLLPRSHSGPLSWVWTANALLR